MKNIINSSIPLNYCTTPVQVRRIQRPKFPLDPQIIENMISGCRANRDEVCGFITVNQDILYVPNSHIDPHFNFYMDIEDIQEALQIICKINNDSVVGVFHSHPTNIPWPSPVDINGWPNPDLRWRYWIATNHEVVEWCKTR